MTVMIDRFFGVHPEVIRSGLFSKLKEGEIRLYIALMERSEFLCTREVILTDEQIRELVGVAPRTLCNARKKLREVGLILSRSGGGNKYKYILCDPTTGKPYPGETKVKAPYQKADPARPQDAPKETRAQPPRNKLQKTAAPCTPGAYGIPLSFFQLRVASFAGLTRRLDVANPQVLLGSMQDLLLSSAKFAPEIAAIDLFCEVCEAGRHS